MRLKLKNISWILKRGKDRNQKTAHSNSFSGKGNLANVITTSTVFPRLNAAALIKFLAFPMRRLFEGGGYCKIIFLKVNSYRLNKVLGLNYGTAHCKNSEERT